MPKKCKPEQKCKEVSKSKCKPLSELKWDSQKIYNHLRAVSGLFESQLIKEGLDPNKMRNMFYQFFSREYETIEPNSGLQKELKLIEAEYKTYVVYDLQEQKNIPVDGWTNDQIEIYYLFVGEKLNGELVTRNIIQSYTDVCCPKEFQDEMISWSIECNKKANFVNMTLDYHLMIIEICGKWGYQKILDQMVDA